LGSAQRIWRRRPGAITSAGIQVAIWPKLQITSIVPTIELSDELSFATEIQDRKPIGIGIGIHYKLGYN
jgi:hypothetical protein